jgi:L-asparaginase / beta-aspartyl-peptidase
MKKKSSFLLSYLQINSKLQITIMRHLLILLSCSLFLACTPSDKQNTTERLEYAIAIHGGAGVISKDLPADVRDGYLSSLEAALTIGRDHLESGGSSLDAVEMVVQFLEEDPRFNAGRGAVYTNEARHELDASIMDGSTLSAGAVAGVTTVKSPIELARMVMERSRHVLMAGPGAESFADEMGVERVENSYFNTENRRRQLDRLRETSSNLSEEQLYSDKSWQMGTVGAVALDKNGNLAAATSTGGMTNKRFGRVGDSPIIGAGNYANNATCAISATGTGEEFIRHAVAFQISAIMEYTGASLQDAADQVINGKLQPGDGGIIGISHTGEIAMVFNSPGMFRGAADASGRFEVKIWED